MDEKKVKLLVIDDRDQVSLIKEYLNKEIYSIDAEHDWQKALDKILVTEYSLIFLSSKQSGIMNYAVLFLEKLERDKPEKLDIPFLFSIGADDDVESIEKILKRKKFRFIDKDSKDYLGEMEWAIINLVPGVFYIQRRNMERAFSLSQKLQKNIERLEEISKRIDKNKNEIDKIGKDQEEIKNNYAQWKDIFQTMSIFVAVITFAIGIILSILMLLFKSPLEVIGCGITIGHLLVLFLFILAIWSFIPYFVLKHQIKKIIKKNLREIIEKEYAEEIVKRAKEIMTESTKVSNDRSDNV